MVLSLDQLPPSPLFVQGQSPYWLQVPHPPSSSEIQPAPAVDLDATPFFEPLLCKVATFSSSLCSTSPIVPGTQTGHPDIRSLRCHLPELAP
eukprot:g14647.t1